ncbi:MAG: hypothetical protein LUD72_10055 [Bacteroidales bacterium]|nr:hypothetical protein [Bacteroidales bacterium]
MTTFELNKHSIGRKFYFRENNTVYGATLKEVEFIRKPIYTAATEWLFPGRDYHFRLADKDGNLFEKGEEDLYVDPDQCAKCSKTLWKEPEIFSVLTDIGAGEGRIGCDVDTKWAGYNQVEMWNKATKTAVLRLARYKWNGCQVVKGFVGVITRWFINEKGYGIEVAYKVPVEKKFLWFKWKSKETRYVTLFKGDKVPVEGWDDMYLTEEECAESNWINVVDL